MRWERLFADLEGQAEAAEQLARADEVADRVRQELARRTVADRLRAAIGVPIDVTLDGAGGLAGRVAQVGDGWMLLTRERGPDALVLLSAIRGLRGLVVAAVEPGTAGRMAARLSVAHALRLIARDRSPVTLLHRDHETLSGTIDRVGADYIDLVARPAERSRRVASSVSTTVPFEAIAAVLAG
ncbi:MAG TPA: hypothetical protein VG708_00030 [Mycobacteriales bacterium]|nr:hypothetical protein [Mycobacteriales bacterium]